MRNRRIYCFNAFYGLSKSYKNMKEAVNDIEVIKYFSQITHSMKNDTMVYKHYAFSRKPFTIEQKVKFSNIALKKEIESKGEVWRTYKDDIKVSSLGRVKRGNDFLFPYKLDRRIIIEFSRNPVVRISLGRIMGQVFLNEGQPLKKDEIVFHKGSIYDFRPHMLYIGSPSDSQKILQRTNTRTIAQIDDNGEIIELYDSQADCAKANFVHTSTIGRVIKSGKKLDGKKFIIF